MNEELERELQEVCKRYGVELSFVCEYCGHRREATTPTESFYLTITQDIKD